MALYEKGTLEFPKLKVMKNTDPEQFILCFMT